MANSSILLGMIGRPHGVRGLLHVTSYTADPADLAGYGPLSDGAGRHLAIEWRAEGVAAVSLVTAAGRVAISDRQAAAALVNTKLYVARDLLPAPAEDDFYIADLIGLAVQDAAGAALGIVATVHDYGAGASLEIVRADAAPLIVPFTRTCVPVVDLAAGQVRVVPPDEAVLGAPDGASRPGASLRQDDAA